MPNLEMSCAAPTRGPHSGYLGTSRRSLHACDDAVADITRQAPGRPDPQSRRQRAHGGGQSAASHAADAPIVCIVHEDAFVRSALQTLIQSAGLASASFGTAAEFLACTSRQSASCLLLDVHLPDACGLELHKRVAAERTDLPVIFITGCTDIPVTVQAMKAGAIGYLIQPVDDEALLAAIREGLARSEAAHDEQVQLGALRQRYASLSCREREVMSLVVAGLLNKQVAAELDISEITVKAHRGRAMHKMQAASLAGLVTMAARLGLPRPRC